MSKEQEYYDLLTRTDAPVFKKNYLDVNDIDGDSPFNVIFNLVLARQLCKYKIDRDIILNNKFVQSVDENGIDQWEETHFGFIKPSIPLPQRVSELRDKVNNTNTMAVADVILESEVITGLTPIVIRNTFFGGWILDVSAFDVDTFFGDDVLGPESDYYLVIFSDPIDPVTLDRLDKKLTQIEKGGSRHCIFAPIQFWTFDISAFDIDTVLGE